MEQHPTFTLESSRNSVPASPLRPFFLESFDNLGWKCIYLVSLNNFLTYRGAQWLLASSSADMPLFLHFSLVSAPCSNRNLITSKFISSCTFSMFIDMPQKLISKVLPWWKWFTSAPNYKRISAIFMQIFLFSYTLEVSVIREKQYKSGVYPIEF